jgi:hypothetical protein
MWVVTLHSLFLYSAPTLITFLMAQANFEPTFSCINTLTILKPSYYSSYLPAYEYGTDIVFRNILKPSYSSYRPAYEDGTDRVFRNILKPSYSSYLPAYEDGTDRVFRNILKPSYSSYLPAYEDGTDRVFRNVGI